MNCSARCGDRAAAVVDLGDGVLRPACDRCVAGVTVFCPDAKVRRIPRRPSPRNGRTAPTEQTNTFPDRSHR